jgi:hypothetical protein
LECGAASPLCVGHWDFVWDFGTLDLGFDSMNLNAMGRVKAVDFRRTFGAIRVIRGSPDSDLNVSV